MNQPAKSTNIAELPAKKRVAALLQSNKNAITQVLPKHVSPERLMQVAFTAVRTTPKLLECDSNSLIGGIIQCAQLGLEPNTVLGHCYLIPYGANAQLVIGYKGLIDLARRSGQIVSIAAHVVREHDMFDYEYGLEPKLRHIPADGAQRGEITHAYAVAHLKDGGNAFEVMTIGDVHQVMVQSQSKGKWGPWKDHFSEMARKTAIRRLAKFLPLSIELATAVDLDAKASADQDQHLDAVLTGDFEVVNDDQPGHVEQSQTDALKDRLRTEDNPPVSPPSGAPVDSNGVEFDPAIHACDQETGEPLENKDGSWRKKPGKRAESDEDPGKIGDDLDGKPDQGLI